MYTAVSQRTLNFIRKRSSQLFKTRNVKEISLFFKKHKVNKHMCMSNKHSSYCFNQYVFHSRRDWSVLRNNIEKNEEGWISTLKYSYFAQETNIILKETCGSNFKFLASRKVHQRNVAFYPQITGHIIINIKMIFFKKVVF